jgi:hypothetical protein
MEIQVVCTERNPQGRIIRISQSGGPLIDLNRTKELVIKGGDTYVATKNDKKLKIYPTTKYPFLTTNPDNPNENDLDFLDDCHPTG